MNLKKAVGKSRVQQTTVIRNFAEKIIEKNIENCKVIFPQKVTILILCEKRRKEKKNATFRLDVSL